MVTHDLDEALLLADRMSILSDGSILQSGSPFEVMVRPDTPRVAGLLGHRNIFRAGVVEHVPGGSATLIEWRGHRLRARLQPQFPAGRQVSWTIPRSHVVLVGRATGGEIAQENAVDGVVAQLVRLGENASVVVHVGGPTRPPVFLSVPIHLARDHDLAPGAKVAVRFLAEAIHLMPGDRHASGRRHARSMQAGNV
jgi:molybdate transport system ATP-binding protein